MRPVLLRRRTLDSAATALLPSKSRRDSDLKGERLPVSDDSGRCHACRVRRSYGHFAVVFGGWARFRHGNPNAGPAQVTHDPGGAKPLMISARLRFRHLLGGLAALLFAGRLAAAASAAERPKYPEYVLGGTELRTLPRSANGRDYLLYVALPYSYATAPNKKYPVVFVCDGYWSFTRMVGLYSSLWYDQVVPEYITVGLGYAGENLDYDKMRQWELSPVRLSLFRDSGHAAKFLEAIEQEIIPFVEREYRADPRHRVLAGGSLGGLFTLYALFTKPELFDGYIAMSPAVGVGGGWMFNYETEFAKARRPLKGRLFMSVGGYEWPSFVDAAVRFHLQLAARKYPDLAYSFRVIDGERHGASNTEATNRGLRYVFEPIAPETGPQH